MSRPLWVVIATGCVPFAAPPLTASVGTGTPARVHVDAGFSPLQLPPDQHHRAWDATLSGSFDRDDRDNRNAWGVAAAGGPMFYPWSDETRLIPEVVGRWTTLGYALDARLAIEISRFTTGEFASKDVAGVAHGEYGIGGYVEAGRLFGDDRAWTATIGVMLRLPAALGVTVVDLR